MNPEDLAAHGTDLYRFALSLSRDEARAADLVQDTFVRAIERADQYRGDAPLGAWLRRILHNLAVDTARHHAHEIAVDDVEAAWRDDAYTVDPEVVVERAQLRDDLEDALARIPFEYRTPVVLHDVEGWKVREIAELLDLGLPAAKQRLRRGRMALTSALAFGAERRRELDGVPLRCWEARQHVSDYLDGELEPQTVQSVQAHLEGCPTCPPLVASIVGAHDQLPELRDSDKVLPPEMVGRLRELTADWAR